MEDKELIIKEQNGVIEALKASNDERQKIIDDLLKEDLIKHNVIGQLRRRVLCLTKTKERLLKR